MLSKFRKLFSQDYTKLRNPLHPYQWDYQKMSDTNNKKIGIVREIRETHGFIADGEMDRFFHWSYMDKDSRKPFHHLRVGDRVYFTPDTKNDKPQATEVSIVPFDKSKRVM